jgi:hypothetical protein
MLVHAPTRSLLVNVPDPVYAQTLLPKSKILDHPDFNFAVKHTLESVKVLRNIGVEAPAPIHHQYDWPGKYQPFAHQRVMAEFMTLHRRCFNLSEMGCVDATTEYLSPEGWRRIDQYAGGDVAQYWPETGHIEFVRPTDYVKLPCTEMVRFKTTRGVDQLLSPEHRVLLADGRVLPAEAIEQQYGPQGVSKTFRFRTTFHVGDRPGLPLSDDLIRLQIAANADGWFDGNKVYIRLRRERKIARLRSILTRSGVDHWERPCEPEGFVKFSFVPPMPKGFGPRWFDATGDQLRIIVDELPHWDGTFRKAGGEGFYSSSAADIDFAQYAYAATGRRATVAWARGEGRVHARKGDPTVGLYGRTSSGDAVQNVWREPSPDGHKYCFVVPSTFLLLRRNGCIFATGNTGKTASTLWAADFMMQQGFVQKALIITPLSTMERVWVNDIFDILMHRVVSVVHGDRQRRQERLDVDADFYILNHDGVKIGPIAEAIRRRPDINLVIVDEGSMFRNHDSGKYKALTKMLRDDMRLWWLTGTPCPNAPTDAWAQARLVSPGKVPKFFGSFKRQTMLQVSQFKWAPKLDAYTTAYDAMQPAVRFKKADCLDLPPVVTLERQATMSKEQREAFNDMRKAMVAEAKSRQITAVNAADKIGKLRQILCGAIRDPNGGDYIMLPHEPRLNVLLEAIEQASAKVIVIVPFKGIIEALEREVSKHYSVGVLNGDVSPKMRDKIIVDFKTTPDPHVLLCHPKVMAHGLNLTEADTTIFYAPIYSNDEYQQVIERNNRTGQTRKMTIVRIGAHPLEWEIYKLVDVRALTQASILGLFKTITE